MSKTIEQARDHAAQMVSDFHDQKVQMEEADKMFFMDWDEALDTEKDMKRTISPSARNALLGAIRLMTSTEPIFSVPFEKNDKKAREQSEKIESFCTSVWYHSGRFRNIPLEQPAIESLLRYGMMVLAIVDTRDLRDLVMSNGKSKAMEKQLDKLVKSTPYLIEAWDPKGVYYEHGRYGLSAVYREVQMTVAEVIEQFGEGPLQDVISNIDDKLHTYVNYCDYWDLESHITWINASITQGEVILAGKEIMNKKHDLPCIPIVIQTSEGSYLDPEPEKQAIPFLYTIQKSGLWKRQNLELTHLYTNLFYVSINPTFLYVTTGDGTLVTDYSIPGGRVELRPGEEYRQLEKNVIDPDMLQGLSIADGLVEESSLYRQALGGMGRLGANAAFSTVSLLHQAGRLPLSSAQKRGGWALGQVCELMIEMFVDKYKVTQYKTMTGFRKINIDEIPEDLLIEGKLDVALPQDQLSQANIAQLITQSGLASKRWTREHVLNMGQSDDMEQEIWNENAEFMTYQRKLQKFAQMEDMQMQQMMMAQQQAMQGPPQGMPPQGMPPQGMPPQGMPPQGMPPQGQPNSVNAQMGMLPAQRPGEKPVPVVPGEVPNTGEPQEGSLP